MLEFQPEEQPPYPIIEVVVSYSDRQAKVNAKVDTGFNGQLTSGKEAVRSLSMKPVGKILVGTAVGNRKVPICPVNVFQADLNLSHSTIAIGTDRSVVGRKLLKKRRWLPDCEEHRSCVLLRTC